MEMLYRINQIISRHLNIESLQYKTGLAIKGTIRDSSKEKLHQKLGFEALKDSRWMRKLCCLYKIISSKLPSYLYLSVNFLTKMASK